MKFSCKVPTNMGIEDTRSLFTIATRAEELGFESLWVSDHLFNAGHVAERIGNRPYYEPMTTLSFLAAITSSIRLGTSVLVLPYHHPINLAKVVATLDVFSGGRLNLGLGAGQVQEEYSALGVNFGERGAITDEGIQVLKVLWSQDSPSFEGRYHKFSGMGFSPKPAQKPHPPIFIGGNSRAAIRRAARLGDWWHPFRIGPEELRRGLEYLQQEAIAFGRDPAQIKLSLHLEMELYSSSRFQPKPHIAGTHLIGTPEEVTKSIRAYQDAGLDHLLVVPTSQDPQAIGDAHELFAREVMPALS